MQGLCNQGAIRGFSGNAYPYLRMRLLAQAAIFPMHYFYGTVT